MKLLEKMRNLPLWKRKIIFWAVIALCAIALGFAWAKNSQKELQKFEKENFLEKWNPPSYE